MHYKTIQQKIENKYIFWRREKSHFRPVFSGWQCEQCGGYIGHWIASHWMRKTAHLIPHSKDIVACEGALSYRVNKEPPAEDLCLTMSAFPFNGKYYLLLLGIQLLVSVPPGGHILVRTVVPGSTTDSVDQLAVSLMCAMVLVQVYYLLLVHDQFEQKRCCQYNVSRLQHQVERKLLWQAPWVILQEHTTKT